MNEILKERFFKLEQELELANAEIAKLKAELEAAKNQLRNLSAELALTINPDKDSLLSGVQRLSALLHEAKADNARLAAALSDWDVLVEYQGKDGRRDWQLASDWLMPGDVIAVIRPNADRTKALHDLLAPTLSCLKTIAQSKTGINSGLARVELKRLRALCG